MNNEEVYQMYMEEISRIPKCENELEDLLLGVRGADEISKKRIVEGYLYLAASIAKEYENQGVLLSDLIQEANMALVLAVENYQSGIFLEFIESQIREALKSSLEEQKQEELTQEEIVARVNVLDKVAQKLAEDLGREATVEELAEFMKMTVEEIKGIMKVTIDAMTTAYEIEE